MRRRSREAERRYAPFELPGLTTEEAAVALIARSALTWEELLLLEQVADGDEVGPLNVSPARAAGWLARWRGPIRGLRLMPLSHWGTAMVRGGVPYDRARREHEEDGNPFAGDERGSYIQ